MENKRADIEMSFSWLFAIIVGAFIIFLAIFLSAKLIQSQNFQADTKTAKQLTNIFEPMETGTMEIKKPEKISFASEVKLYDKCSAIGFGNQKFSVSSKTLNKWSEPGGEISVADKYVFSDKIEQGRDFYIFSLPFDFPFKVSEIIILSSGKYCFVEPPNFIEEDIKTLNLKEISILNESCIGKKVCFGDSNCDINVAGLCSGDCENEYDYGYVIKGGKQFYYAGNLIYAAIFSDKDIYECNVKRLMKRASELCRLYADEASFLESKGCGSGISSSLLLTAGMTGSLKSSSELINLYQQAKSLEAGNSALECNLW